MQGDRVSESGAFPTEAACEDYRSKTVTDVKKRLLADAPPGVEKMASEIQTTKWTFALGALHSQCISAGDPRLKPD